MKVFLFTHISDIDGLNNVVLAKQAFEQVDYVLCEADGIDEQIEKRNKLFAEYDYVFVTDLCPNEATLSLINNSDLKYKFKVFDHHKGALDQISNHYEFVTIRIENTKGLCSGTSLFYEYLVDNKYLIPNLTLDRMVELTRKYDTWEWKETNELEARDLTWLFYACGIDEYLTIVSNKLVNDCFVLDDSDYAKINKWKNEFDLKIKKIVDEMMFIEVEGYKAGIVKTIYEYRNDVAEYIRENKYDIDFLALVFIDNESVSYRSIKDDVDVNEIAKKYGGKGHVKAASSPITEEEKNNIIEYFMK